MDRQVDFGNILQGTISLLGDSARAVAIYVAIVGGLGLLGVVSGLSEVDTSEFGFNYGFVFNNQTPLLTSLFDLFSTVVGVVAGYWLLTCYLAARGRFPGENRFWHYLGMAILSAIAIAIGFVFVIVPGIILMVRWSAASGFVIGARDGVIDSLSASWHATRGHSWPIFFAGLVLVIGLLVLLGVLTALFGLFGVLVAAGVDAIAEAFLSTVAMAMGIAIYCLVHDDAAEVGEVFA
jgi:hypothetical protein